MSFDENKFTDEEILEESEFEDEIEYVSKTQLKKEAKNLQDIGEKLLTLSAQELKKIPLPDNLKEALELAIKIQNKRGALKRQKQYIGKIMRDIDPGPIIQSLNELEGQDEKQKAYFHRLENLRSQLIEEGDSAIGILVNEFEDIDRQKIRQLIRKAKKEIETGKNTGAQKEIFRYLKGLKPKDM